MRSLPGPCLWRGCSDLAATRADVLLGHRRKLRLQQRPVLGRQPLSAEARPDVKGRMQPDGPSQLLNFATRSLAAGQLAAAEIASRDLLDLAPDDAALLHLLGYIAAPAGRRAAAIAHFQAALQAETGHERGKGNLLGAQRMPQPAPH